MPFFVSRIMNKMSEHPYAALGAIFLTSGVLYKKMQEESTIPLSADESLVIGTEHTAVDIEILIEEPPKTQKTSSISFKFFAVNTLILITMAGIYYRNKHAKVRAQLDNDGNTPLHRAVMEDDLRKLQVLLNEYQGPMKFLWGLLYPKSDLSKKNKNHLTPLQLAIEKKVSPSVTVCLFRQSKIDIASSEGQSLLANIIGLQMYEIFDCFKKSELHIIKDFLRTNSDKLLDTLFEKEGGRSSLTRTQRSYNTHGRLTTTIAKLIDLNLIPSLRHVSIANQLGYSDIAIALTNTPKISRAIKDKKSLNSIIETLLTFNASLKEKQTYYAHLETHFPPTQLKEDISRVIKEKPLTDNHDKDFVDWLNEAKGMEIKTPTAPTAAKST